MENPCKRFQCSNHHQQISFVCAVNQWHFQPLCNSCIGDHTQKHSKKVKIFLENVTKVQQKIRQQKQKAIQIYQKRAKQIESLFLIKEQDFEQYSILKKVQDEITTAIHNWFSKLTEQIKQKRKQHANYQQKLLLQLQQNINLKIQDFKNLSDLISNEKWIDIAKSIYFKEDLDLYVKQIDEVIQQYRNMVVDKIQQFVADAKNAKVKLQDKIIADLNNWRNTEKEEQPKPKKIKKIQKEKPKIPQKSKKCPACGEEMQYLTDLKKHLVCRYCGGKQRNYTKK